MRSSILKLTSLIVLMLVTYIPSFGGTLYDNLGAQVAGTSGTDFGDIALAQRFSVSDNNVDYTFAFNFGGFGWFTGYGSANLMQVVWDDTTDALSARLAVFNDVNGDVGVPTVSIYSDVFNADFLQPEPGASLSTLNINPAFVPFPNTLSFVLFTGSANLVDGTSYWMVLTSPLGVDTQWAYTAAPEPVTLAMVGGALVVLSLRRKRRQK